jgi:hypothetical protein
MPAQPLLLLLRGGASRSQPLGLLLVCVPYCSWPTASCGLRTRRCCLRLGGCYVLPLRNLPRRLNAEGGIAAPVGRRDRPADEGLALVLAGGVGEELDGVGGAGFAVRRALDGFLAHRGWDGEVVVRSTGANGGNARRDLGPTSRSMPRPSLEKTELEGTRSPVASVSKLTPPSRPSPEVTLCSPAVVARWCC